MGTSWHSIRARPSFCVSRRSPLAVLKRDQNTNANDHVVSMDSFRARKVAKVSDQLAA